MANPRVKDATRSLKHEDGAAIYLLSSFLEPYDISYIDIEPMDRGIRLHAVPVGGGKAFVSWGIDVTDAVRNMIESADNSYPSEAPE